MAKKGSDFDFSDFYLDDVAEEEEIVDIQEEEPVGVFSDEEDYDKLLDLTNDESHIAVDAKYPYLRVSGFLNKSSEVLSKEIELITERLTALYDSVADKVKEEDMIDVAIEVAGGEYIVSKAPLTLDTILTIIAPHRYKIDVVKDSDSCFEISGTMLRGLIFT